MKKKKLIILIVGLLLVFIWKDYKKIDIHYVNQSPVTYDFSNINNNILKKLIFFLDKEFELFLVNNFKKHKKYWTLEKKSIREKDNLYVYFKNKSFFNKSENKDLQNPNKWHRSHGDNTSNRFSNLKLINVNNAKDLKLEWIFKGDDLKSDIQANPIFAENRIFTPISGGYIAAIDPSNGSLVWKSKKFSQSVAQRGLVYWQGNEFHNSRLYFSNREKLISLDAKTGKPVKTFGNEEYVRTGLSSITPVINHKRNEIYLATWSRAIEVYDLLTGKPKWKIKYYPSINKRIGGKKYNNLGANPWGGISFDEKREILYITTGNPHSYFDGTQRPGKNTGSCSIIAIDMKKKKIIWTFQESIHDIWNSDLPAPPILTTIFKDNQFIDVVVTPTKRANTLILDRVTGEPIFPYRYRKAPVSEIPGEKTSNYQPDLEIPEPFGKNIFTKNDFWSYDEILKIEIKKKYEKYRYGFYETFKLNHKNLQFNMIGGAEWMGGSVDHINQIMYVTSNNIPWETWIEKKNNLSKIPSYKSYFKRALDNKGYPISKPPWGTISAINLNNGKILWQIPFGEYDELSQKGFQKTGTENFGGVTGSEGGILFATGTIDKKFYVFDSSNGKELFSYKMEYVGSAPPTTFIYKNKQYVIIHSTGGKNLEIGYPDKVKDGNLIYAFSIN